MGLRAHLLRELPVACAYPGIDVMSLAVATSALRLPLTARTAFQAGHQPAPWQVHPGDARGGLHGDRLIPIYCARDHRSTVREGTVNEDQAGVDGAAQRRVAGIG